MLALRLTVGLLVATFAVSATAQVQGVSPSGHKGVLHTVVKGDTLWDITARYLETPWIWPSIWKENEGIDNPHLIFPGDLIWISEKEMRKVTPEEAAAMLAGDPAAPAPLTEPTAHATPMEPDIFAALDGQSSLEGPSVIYAGLHRASFVTAEELDAAGAILGNHREHYWLAETHQVIVSLGEGRVDIGQDFSVFRVRRRVLHPETRRPVGYFVEIVGRAEITEVYPETSFAVLTTSYSEVEPGDRLTPYIEPPETFPATSSPEVVAGIVLAQQPHRVVSGRGDLVVLDKGTNDGLEAGRELLVYRPGHDVVDPLTSIDLLEPDYRIARVFVLKSGIRTSLALVTQASTEIREGDRFRSR